ncbi:MAG: DUF1924 domain-containing protein [Thermodesulfovibrionales bacterium]|jgi:cytochrome c peroxidase
MKKLSVTIGAVLCLASVASAASFNPEVSSYMKELEKTARQADPAFKGFDAKNGKNLFFQKHPNKEVGEIACSTCHTADLKKEGKNPKTGKVIEPLAPSVNKKRLTDVKEIQKWLRRNFKDVMGREGSAKEKGDVLTFISEN